MAQFTSEIIGETTLIHIDVTREWADGSGSSTVQLADSRKLLGDWLQAGYDSDNRLVRLTITLMESDPLPDIREEFLAKLVEEMGESAARKLKTEYDRLVQAVRPILHNLAA